MGAWGHGSFDNDSALDWVNDLEDEGAAALVRAVKRVAEFEKDEYLEVDDASAAVAGAEIVAAARDGDLSRLPENVQQLLTKDLAALVASPSILATAHAALLRVVSQSELKELMTEGIDKTPGEAWLKDMAALSVRLQ